ncbi:hypothetical protein DFH09DRAFT_1091980 [Mycena vulgaris]|nr:hypothetical protein DFH09DRAFT_1091980 [Mycena vulgaris]
MDLAQFPALNYLELPMHESDPSDLKAALSRLRPRNCVQVLVFAVWHIRSTNNMDTFVADYPMLAPWRVEAQVHGPSNIVEFLPEAVRVLCPQLDARRLLAVLDHRWTQTFGKNGLVVVQDVRDSVQNTIIPSPMIVGAHSEQFEALIESGMHYNLVLEQHYQGILCVNVPKGTEFLLACIHRINRGVRSSTPCWGS